MLKFVKKVSIQFTPGDFGSVSARELLQRISGDRAKKSNPVCLVEFKIAEGQGEKPYVELVFTDGEQRKMLTADLSVQEIAKMIELKGSEMELKGVMKVQECLATQLGTLMPSCAPSLAAAQVLYTLFLLSAAAGSGVRSLEGWESNWKAMTIARWRAQRRRRVMT